jgi:superfamily II DNA or RNA helicase
VDKMPDIKVHFKDHVNVFIETTDAIAWELREYFTFFVPGYQFMPAFKSKIWDGKIRLFDIRFKTLLKGLLYKLENFAKERDYHLVYSYEEYDNEISLKESEEFISSLKQENEARDYQILGFAKAIRKKRLLLLSPTSSGKSKIIYDIIRKLQTHKEIKKGLVIVPTVQLVEQLYKDFENYSRNNGWNTNDYVHKVYQGKIKQTDKLVTITTWQSIYTMPEEWFKQFDFVFGDEVHTFKAKSLTYIMNSLVNAEYRIGLTGTLDGTLTHKLALEGLFGPVTVLTTLKELMDKKYVSELNIRALVLKHPKSVCDVAKKWKYQDEIEYLMQCEPRNEFIKNLALSLNGNTLVLYRYIEKHGEILHKLIKENLPDTKNLHFVNGKTDVEIREEIRNIISKSDNNIFVASLGTSSTGLNMPNLHNMIYASPFKGKIQNLQSLGRGIRLGKSGGKNEHTLYDIGDDLRSSAKENFALKHFAIRMQTYVSEKLKYKVYKIQLKEK